MQRKMLALDIDGTVTNSKKEVSPATKEAIRRVTEAGHIVVIASGRPTAGTERVRRELELDKRGGYVLSYNGAKICEAKSGRIIYHRVLERSIVPEIYEYALKNDAGMMVYNGADAVTGTRVDDFMRLEAKINGIGLKKVENFTRAVDFDTEKCLLTAQAERAERMERDLSAKLSGRASVYRSEPFFTEVMPFGVDKASSLGALLEILGMKREDLICCGDGFNDLSMIKFAGLGVAMANAAAEVLAAADFVTLSNDEDGIVKVIDKFMLNSELFKKYK